MMKERSERTAPIAAKIAQHPEVNCAMMLAPFKRDNDYFVSQQLPMFSALVALVAAPACMNAP